MKSVIFGILAVVLALAITGTLADEYDDMFGGSYGYSPVMGSYGGYGKGMSYGYGKGFVGYGKGYGGYGKGYGGYGKGYGGYGKGYGGQLMSSTVIRAPYPVPVPVPQPIDDGDDGLFGGNGLFLLFLLLPLLLLNTNNSG